MCSMSSHQHWQTPFFQLWNPSPSVMKDKYPHIDMLQIKNLKLERALLESLHHPGIVGFFFTFQDQTSLYFGLELCPNGERF